MDRTGEHDVQGADECAVDLECEPPQLLVPARALLIGRKDSRFRSIAAALRERSVTPLFVEPAKEDPFALLSKDPRIAALLVRHGQLSRVHAATLGRLIFDRPSLTAAILGTRDPAAFVAAPSAQVFSTRHSATAIVDHIVDKLCDHYFDDDIVELLCQALGETLADTKVSPKRSRALLRVSSAALGEMTALTAFRGPFIAGQVSIAGPPVFFERLARSWSGTRPQSREAVWDAAGELGNRITGLVRRHYLRLGMDAKQSVPMIVEGEGVSIRSMTTKPGLVVPFDVPRIAAPVHVELVLAWRESTDVAREPLEQMPQQELVFL